MPPPNPVAPDVSRLILKTHQHQPSPTAASRGFKPRRFGGHNCLSIVFLALGVLIQSHGADYVPLTRPDFQQFDRPASARMSEAARTNLAPVYPYLAEHIVQQFGLTNQAGIGLDIGGGPGSLVLELSRRTPRFYWINTDINTFHAETFFARAADAQCAGRVGMVFADAHHLPFRDNYADVVVSRGSLPFWAEPKAALAEIRRVLKPGGRAFIGRGFPPNLPLETAKRVRANQGAAVPKYDVAETMASLRQIMRELNLVDFEVTHPRAEQTEVNYGVWLRFTK